MHAVTIGDEWLTTCNNNCQMPDCVHGGNMGLLLSMVYIYIRITVVIYSLHNLYTALMMLLI